MMTAPTQKLIQRLRDIKQLATQTEQGIVSNIEVQRTHPERIANAEKWFALGLGELKLVREEDEVGVAHWDEISEALPMVIDRLNNQITLQQNLDFILATDKQALERFIGFVLQYGMSLFGDALEQMPDGDFAQVEDIIDTARRRREG